MADLGQTFDPSTVPPDDRDFDLLPNGQYEAQIIESDLVDTKDGTGKLLNLTWEIISGPFANRKVWERVNIQNRSAQAQDIGQRQLASICEATGVGAIRDSQDLHYKPCLIVVGVEKDKSGEYPDKNKVSRVRPLGGGATAQRQAAPQQQQRQPAQQQAEPQQQRAAAGGGSRPWKR